MQTKQSENYKDPCATDPDKYHSVFENEKVRVFRYTDKPCDKTLEHFHPNFMLYALAPFKRKIYLPSGKVISREFNTGDCIWSEAQTHIGENVGETNTEVLMIEIKS